MDNKKLEIESLKCSNNNIEAIFYITCITYLISEILGLLCDNGAYNDNSGIEFWECVASICQGAFGMWFFFIVSKACRNLGHGLKPLFATYAVLQILSGIFSGFANFSEAMGMFAVISSGLGIILCLILGSIIWANYKGYFVKVGKGFVAYPLVIIYFLIKYSLKSHHSNSEGQLAFIVLVSLLIYICCILYPLYVLLKRAYDEWDVNELQYDLENSTDREVLSEINTRSDSETQGSNLQPQIGTKSAEPGVSDTSQNFMENLLGKNWKPWLGIIVLGIIAFGLLCYIVFGKSREKTEANMDEEWDEWMETEETEEEMPEEIVYNSEDENSEDEYGTDNRPSWLEDIMRGESEWWSYSSEGEIRNAMRLMDSRYVGTIRKEGEDTEYPIIMYLNLTESGEVTGRYAYRSTIEKYGDKEKNWFYINGSLLSNAYVGGEDSFGFALESRRYEHNATYEYIFLETIGSSELSGWLLNKTTYEEGTGHRYFIDLTGR